MGEDGELAAAAATADGEVKSPSGGGGGGAATSEEKEGAASAPRVQSSDDGMALMVELAREHWGSLLLTVAITVVAALLKMTSTMHMVREGGAGC